VVTDNSDDPGQELDPDGASPEALPIPNADDDAADDAESDPSNPDFSSLLRNFGDAHDLDDQLAEELDTGFDIGEAPAFDGDAPEAPLDLGEVIEAPFPFASSLLVGADDLGPEGDAGGADAVEPPPTALDEEGEGVLGDDALPPELGSLGADTPDDEEPPKISLDEIGLRLENESPSPPMLPWPDVPVARSRARSRVVAVRGRVVAAGTEIVAVDDIGAESILVPNTGGAVTSLLAMPDGAIFYTTRRGQLFRVTPQGPECVTAWMEVFDLESSACALGLGGMTPSSRPAMLLHAGNQRKELLESTDHGSTFRRVDLGGSVVALGAGAPPVCVVKNERGIRILRSEPTGGFSVVSTEWGSDVDAQALAASGGVVAALDPERGVRVSDDGGRSFHVVAGSRGATAVTAGHVG